MPDWREEHPLAYKFPSPSWPARSKCFSLSVPTWAHQVCSACSAWVWHRPVCATLRPNHEDDLAGFKRSLRARFCREPQTAFASFSEWFCLDCWGLLSGISEFRPVALTTSERATLTFEPKSKSFHKSWPRIMSQEFRSRGSRVPPKE